MILILKIYLLLMLTAMIIFNAKAIKENKNPQGACWTTILLIAPMIGYLIIT